MTLLFQQSLFETVLNFYMIKYTSTNCHHPLFSVYLPIQTYRTVKTTYETQIICHIHNAVIYFYIASYRNPFTQRTNQRDPTLPGK